MYNRVNMRLEKTKQEAKAWRVRQMKKYYYVAWTQADDDLLARIMANESGRRVTLTTLLQEAAEELNRTFPSVRNRWYKLCELNNPGRKNKNHSQEG